MKKVKKFLLGNIKTVVSFILGIIISGVTVYAATIIASNQVGYDNTSSGMSATNVQDAIDELYTKANSIECKKGYAKQNETSSGYECNKIEYYKNCSNGEDTSIPKSDNTYASYSSSCIIPNFNGTVISSSDSNSVTTCRYDNIETAKIEDYVSEIGSYQFAKCSSLSAIMIPISVSDIGASAFTEATSLTYVYIPNSVTSIGNYAFRGTTSLAYVFIPNSVTYIGKSAFYSTPSLTSVNYNGTNYTSKSTLISALQANSVYVGNYAFDNTGLSD